MKPCQNKDCIKYDDRHVNDCSMYSSKVDTCPIYKRLYMPKEVDLNELYDKAYAGYTVSSSFLNPTYKLLKEIVNQVNELKGRVK